MKLLLDRGADVDQNSFRKVPLALEWMDVCTDGEEQSTSRALWLYVGDEGYVYRERVSERERERER